MKLAEIHYKNMGDLGIVGREKFLLTDKKQIQELPEHNMYLCREDALEMTKVLTFRDELRKSADLRSEYTELKQRFAEEYPEDIDGYAESKSKLIRRVLGFG